MRTNTNSPANILPNNLNDKDKGFAINETNSNTRLTGKSNFPKG